MALAFDLRSIAFICVGVATKWSSPNWSKRNWNEAKTLSSNENSKAAVDKKTETKFVIIGNDENLNRFCTYGKGVRRILGQDLPKMQKLFPNSL